MIATLTGVFPVERSLAAGVALVSHLVFLAPPTVLGAVYLWRSGLSWGRVLGLGEPQAGAPRGS